MSIDSAKVVKNYPLLLAKKSAWAMGVDVDLSVAMGSIIERRILMASALAATTEDFETKLQLMLERVEQLAAEFFLIYVSHLVERAQKTFLDDFQFEVDEDLMRDIVRKGLQDGRLRALPARTNDQKSIYQIVYSARNEAKLKLLYAKCFEKLRRRGRATPDDFYSAVWMIKGKWAPLFESHLACLGYATIRQPSGDLFSPRILKSSA